MSGLIQPHPEDSLLQVKVQASARKTRRSNGARSVRSERTGYAGGAGKFAGIGCALSSLLQARYPAGPKEALCMPANRGEGDMRLPFRNRVHRACMLATLISAWAAPPHLARSQQPLERPPMPLAGVPEPAITDCPPPDVRDELFKPLTQIPGSIPREEPDGAYPVDCSQTLFEGIGPARTAGAESYFVWHPATVMYRTAYFDDVPLERHGQSICPTLQPVISGARFFGTFAVLPYKMGYQAHHEHVTDAGLMRPGSPAPCLRERLVWTPRGALLQASAVTGLVFALP